MTNPPSSDYSDKTAAYFSVDRHDLFALVPKVPNGRMLEIGAAEGAMLVALKKSGKAREVVGVELVALPGTSQNNTLIDRFIVADIEERSLDLERETFDVVICGDVLEHLRDPWAAIQYLSTFLRHGGTFVVSLPNILYWRAFGRIVTGDFRYAPSGVLDRTHLRFFCRKNMLDLVESANLQLRHIEPSFRRHRELRRDKLVNTLTLGVLERFFAQQYLIVAEKPV